MNGAAPMADQTAVLKLLARSKAPLTVTRILQRCGQMDLPPARRVMVAALGRLMAKKLIERAGDDGTVATSFSDRARPRAFYRATETGREFIRAGKRITSGNNGKWNAPTRVLPDTQRQKFWSALRIAKKATLADLASAAGGDAEKAIENARKYLKGLSRAGVVALLPVRAQGHAPSSPGFVRYAIARDLGREAPVVAKKGVFDPNARTTIPYAEAKR